MRRSVTDRAGRQGTSRATAPGGLNFHLRRARKSPPCKQTRPAVGIVTNKTTLAPARGEQHDCGLARALLAMTSHN
jgi:hypothetical protein